MAISGTPLTNSAAVTLNLTCTDGTGSGCAQTQFSNDYSAWTPLTAYFATASWNLSDPAYGGDAADGTKTVYTRFRDTAGNLSSVATETIILYTSPPTGSITINDGAQYVLSTSVTLTVAASDTNGIAQMQFSNDGTTWSRSRPMQRRRPGSLPPATDRRPYTPGSRTLPATCRAPL